MFASTSEIVYNAFGTARSPLVDSHRNIDNRTNCVMFF